MPSKKALAVVNCDDQSTFIWGIRAMDGGYTRDPITNVEKTWSVEIHNVSMDCTGKVGISSTVINHGDPFGGTNYIDQNFFAGSTTTIGPNSTITLTVNVPSCRGVGSQMDAFIGPLLNPYGEDYYWGRLITSARDGLNCPQTPLPPPTIVIPPPVVLPPPPPVLLPPPAIIPPPPVVIAPPPVVIPPPAIVAPPPPPFDESMCECDGMEHTDIIPGQKTTITAYSKVVGSNVNLAEVTGTKFTFGQSSPGYHSAIQANRPVEIAVNTPSLVRYKSTWVVDIPANPVQNVPYVISAQAQCKKKANVLGVTTQRTASFIDDLVSFFRNLFGIRSASESTASAPPPPLTSTATAGEGGQQLQLRVLKPTLIVEAQCHSIEFIYKFP